MPIAKSAVDAYLARQLETRTWFKSLKPLEVEEYLTYVNPPHKFTIPMRLDQKVCFLLGVAHPETVIMSDLGLGKTGTSLELLSYFYNNKFIRKAFVFAPTDELVEGWEDEIKKWGIDIPYLLLEGSSKKKWDSLAEFDDGVILGTYIGIAAMVSELEDQFDRDGNKLKRQKRRPQKKLIDKILDRVDAVVYDQSTQAGNRGTLNFKVCNRFSEQAQVRFALAGRGFGRDPAPLWSQFMLTDRGRAFGPTIGMFREAFYRRERHKWGSKWVLRKRRQKTMARFVAASSIRYATDECVELPPKVKVLKECHFPDENWSYYERIRKEILQQRGNYREVRNSFLRMRQISSGFIGFIDDETGDRAQIEFEENPKLDLLMDLVAEVPEDQKLIIFHEYNWSGSRICQELAKEKYKHGWLWGGTKDWTSIKNSFNNDPDYRVLVANSKKGSLGLNLQSASYIFYYESPLSVIDRAESEGRIHRTGQTRKCFIYDVVVKNSVDERILEYQQAGADLFKAIVEDPSRLFRNGKIGRLAR